MTGYERYFFFEHSMVYNMYMFKFWLAVVIGVVFIFEAGRGHGGGGGGYAQNDGRWWTPEISKFSI